jgi:hypothetical protein
MFYPEAAFAASRLSLSSAILSFTPFPRGNDTYGLVAFPIMNTLFNLVTERGKIQMNKNLNKQLDLLRDRNNSIEKETTISSKRINMHN